MAVTDKVLQIGPSGTRVIPDANVAEVGAGVTSTLGNLSVAAKVGFAVIVNDGQINMDFRVRGQTDADLLVVDASTNAIGVGVSAPTSQVDMDGALTVRGMAAPALSAAGTGRLYFDSTSNTFQFSQHGAAYQSMLTGTGSSGRLAYWTGTAAMSGEDNLFWDAANDRLGVRTASPATAIHLASGQMGAPDGTVGAPSYSFSSALSGGLYASGAEVRLASGGVDRVTAGATGVILTGPTEEVVSGTGTTLRLHMNNSGAAVDAKRWAFSFDSTVNNNELRLVTETDALVQTAVLAIDRSGQVGIGSGITTPGAMLDVRGSVIFNEAGAAVDFRVEGDTEPNLFVTDGSADRVGVGTAAPSSRVHVVVGDGAVDGTRGVRVSNSTDSALLEVGTSGGSYVGTSTAADFSLRSNNIARITAASTGAMVINEGGLDYDLRVEGDTDANLLVVDAGLDRVGIGTTAPAGKVEIRDDANINLILTKTGAGAGTNDLMEFRTDAFTSGERHLFRWTSNSGAVVTGRIGMEFDAVSNTIDFVFRDMFNTSPTTVESMRLKGNGNLGLGVTDAQVQLDMSGAFQMRGSSAPAVSPSGRGRIYFDSATSKWKISENGGAYQDLLGAGSLTGSGAASRIAFWTGASTLASDSDFTWDSTNNRLGIAVAGSPNTAFDFTGALSIRSMAAPAVSPAGQGRLYFDSGTNKWRISENGGPYQDLLGSGAVTGSGAINQLAFWNGTTVLTGDASLYWDNASNLLGINEGTPTSTLDVNGSVATAVTTVTTGSTNLTVTHHTILADASGGNVTVTLPLASAASGREYRVKRTDASANTVSVTRSGADTIDGATSVSLPSQYQVLTFVSNGTAWFLF